MEEKPHMPILERINDAKKFLGEIRKIVHFLTAQEQNFSVTASLTQEMVGTEEFHLHEGVQ